MFINLSTFFGTNVSSRRVIPLYLCSSDFAALLVLSCIFRELVPDLVHTLDFSCSGDDDTVSNVTDRFRRATTVNLHQFPPVMDGIVHALARLEFLRTLNLAAGTQVVDIKIFSNFQHVEVIVVSGRNIQGRRFLEYSSNCQYLNSCSLTVRFRRYWRADQSQEPESGEF